MALIAYTKKQLIQRIRQHLVNGWPDASASVTEHEVLLYIDQALAFTLVGSVYAMAKIEGNICIPEAYLTTYLLPSLKQDNVTKYWYTTLPQPPISLPLGYSLDRLYFANNSDGEGQEIFLIKAKRVAYRKNMPMPFGVRGWIEGSKLTLAASNGGALLDQPLYVRMASTRTENINDAMGLPDDAISAIFNDVVAKLKDRLQLPKDVVVDDISTGNKSS